MNSLGALDDRAQSVAFVIVEKKGHPSMLKIVIDPAVEISRLAAMFRHHDDAADLFAGARQQAPARIVIMQDRVDLPRQVDQGVATADMGRAQHVTLKRFDGLQHLGRFHGALGLALDDDVEVIRALKLFVDMAHA